MSRLLVVAIAGIVVGVLVSPAWGQGFPCTQCGPGLHWIDGCAAGQDLIANQSAVVGIDNDLDCIADVSLILDNPFGLLTVNRSGPLDDSAFFPGLRAVDGHLDVIDTEIIQLSLSGVTVTLKAGLGQGNIISASHGAVSEDPGDPAIAESFFDVYFEVDLGGGMYVYNQTPMRIQADITCAPPRATYIHPVGCLALYTSPVPGQGMHVANLVTAQHLVNTFIPTLTQWGLILLTLLLAATAGFVLIRRRRQASNVA